MHIPQNAGLLETGKWGMIRYACILMLTAFVNRITL